jgi:glycosyl transferase family 25
MDVYQISESQDCDNDIIKVMPVNGPKLYAKDFFEKSVEWYNKSGKLISPSEAGCTLSHLSIYEKIVSSQRPALILETDITATEEQMQKVKEITQNLEVDFIHLGWHPSIFSGTYFKGKFDSKLGLYQVNPYSNFHGTYAYYITPRCAKELLAFHKTAFRKADSWAIYFAETTIIPYFYPIFTHPPARRGIDNDMDNDMDNERLKVNRRVYSIDQANIIFFIKKAYNQYFKNVIGFTNITPERANQDLKNKTDSDTIG